MNEKTIKAAIETTSRLLKNADEPWKSLAFPVVLTQVLQGGLGRSEEPLKRTTSVPRAVHKKPTRSATLRKVVAEGWFKTQRSLADIRKELRNRGLPTKTTTLPSLVLPLVLEGKLKRKPVRQGTKEFYVYFS